jgi:hypothetical protein
MEKPPLSLQAMVAKTAATMAATPCRLDPERAVMANFVRSGKPVAL